MRRVSTNDRIALLRHMVAPNLQKGDTASVLGEVVAFLRGAYKEVREVTAPLTPSRGSERSSAPVESVEQEDAPPPSSDQDPVHDLESRGLCLVPLAAAQRALAL